MSKKEDIRKYAKKLFLAPDETGKHKYSLRTIEKKILHKFGKGATNQIISIWSKKYGWQSLWDEAVRQGITEVAGQKDKDKAIDERYKEAIAQKIREDFLMATDLKKWAYKYIKTHKVQFANIREAIAVFDTGMKYTQEIGTVPNGGVILKIVVDDDDTQAKVQGVLKGDRTK